MITFEAFKKYHKACESLYTSRLDDRYTNPPPPIIPSIIMHLSMLSPQGGEAGI
jgi:hypothetical protein